MPRFVVILMLTSAGFGQTTDRLDFNRDVRPILSDRCFPCHGPDAEARQAGLRLDLRDAAIAARPHGAAIVPEHPETSQLVARVRANGKRQMPPAASKLTLSAGEIRVLEQWVREGAEYRPHWAFVAPTSHAPPPVADTAWVRDPLDRFVLARLEREGLRPSPETDRETWLRRVTFDLSGLPPRPPEIDAFLADVEPGAHERVVDRLLSSVHYGERMAQDWLDVARYADTYGYQSDVTRDVWPWRDWVIRAFNENLPFDRFVTWQLAGDLLPDATLDMKLATTFNRLHRQTNEGGSVEEEYRLEYVGDRVQTFGTAFLGLTLECARCHDHRFDPILQSEYYEVSAFFANIDESGLYSHFTRATPTPALMLTTPDQDSKLEQFAREIRDTERATAEVVADRRPAFDAWLRSTIRAAPEPLLADETGRYPLDALGAKGELVNAIDAKRPGRTKDRPPVIDGVHGQGLLLSGENNAQFPKDGAFHRGDAFTIALWIHAPVSTDRAVVLHRSRAWTDAGSQGYQLLIKDRRLSWSLIHFWPGDAISISARDKLDIGRWVHVAVSYDGSSRASGLRLFVDGVAVPTDVVRDYLTQSITGGGGQLTLGQRFRDRGFIGGRVDDLRVFRRAISPVEVAHLHDGSTLAGLLAKPCASLDATHRDRVFEWWSGSVDARTRKATADLLALRTRRNRLLGGIRRIMTMRELPTPRPTHVLERGSYLSPRAKVSPGTPRMLPPLSADAPKNRLGLAQWLTDPAHPLTGRVAVSRLWQLCFQRGLVATSENFGSQGTAPVHPELLDSLALQFVQSGWDVKAMLRRIVLSATYRQGSRRRADLDARDPDNLLLARAPVRRLSAEMVRDQALAASGLLVRTVGGPPVKPYQPPGLWKEKSGQAYRRDKGEKLWRRSLYTFWKRTSPPPTMMIFDAAKRDVCVVRRHTTSTPLQHLVMWNDPQLVEAARVLAAAAIRAAPELDVRIRYMFRRLCGRSPRPGELAPLRALWTDEMSHWHTHRKAALAFIGTGDAPLAKDLDAAEVAAGALLGSTLLSYDACQVVR
ncbi:MAG: hypothetical protein CMJ83_09060 [Planctomycetes bacterium]|nr:hypothetical protein [Planctomycetota bacterium]